MWKNTTIIKKQIFFIHFQLKNNIVHGLLMRWFFFLLTTHEYGSKLNYFNWLR
jgi:hypothetical protein